MKNRVHVQVMWEKDANPHDHEYSTIIVGFTGILDIYSPGGADDISLIQECVHEYVVGIESASSDRVINLILKEDGEQEDVFWHKYYTVEEAETATM